MTVSEPKNKSAGKMIAVSMMICCLLLLTGCGIANASDPGITEGVLDLTNWDPDQNGIVRLDGKWKFYWQKLLGYDDLKNTSPDLSADVPKTWDSYSIGGDPLPGFGCATYSIKIKTGLPPDSILGFRIYNFSSAYKLFINDKLVAENGEVGTKAELETGDYIPQTVFFKMPDSEFDIVIQVSNYHYARGGFWYTLVMGSEKSIISYQDSVIGKELVFAGALLFICLFCFCIYLLKRELKHALHFACLCLSIAITQDMVGQFLILRLLPGISFESVILIWYSSTIWVSYFLVLVIHDLFTSKFSKFLSKAALVIGIVFQTIFIATPPQSYTNLAGVCNLFDILAAAGTVIIALLNIRGRSKDAKLYLLGVTAVLVSYVHDILYWRNLIRNPFGEIFHIGLFVFIFLQMLIQAGRIKQVYEQKISAELSFLHAQIQPHFLYNTINTFISISRYDIDKARALLYDFSSYLRSKFDFKDLARPADLREEIEFTKTYVNIEKARFDERLEVCYDIPNEVSARIPRLVIQPLVENAIIHGVLPKPEGGRVDVIIKKDIKLLLFEVRDNGVGMDLNRDRGFGSSKGIGLLNIDNRLKKMYGTGLEIISGPGKGTSVRWQIPVKN